MRKIITVALIALAAGCGNAKFGCESTEVVGPGASLGEVIAKHGAPSAVSKAGSGNVVVSYPIAGVSGMLGAHAAERASSIAYFCGDGKVKGGGYVADGQGDSALGATPIGGVVRPRSGYALALIAASLAAIALGLSLARRPKGVKRATAAVALLLLFVAHGKHKCGCENTTLIAAGSPAGMVIMAHGAPDEVFPAADGGAIICYWIHERHELPVFGSEKVANIAYHIEGGKVTNGGFVGWGEGSWILFAPYSLPKFDHSPVDVAAICWIAIIAGVLFTLASVTRAAIAAAKQTTAPSMPATTIPD